MDRGGNSSFPSGEPFEDPEDYEHYDWDDPEWSGAFAGHGDLDSGDLDIGDLDAGEDTEELLPESIVGGRLGDDDVDDEGVGDDRADGDRMLRGWIDPDDRLWLHPSEVGRASRVQALDDARRRARRSDRRSLFAAGVVGTAAITAAIAAVALATTSSSPHLTAGPAHSKDPATVSTVSPLPKPVVLQSGCPSLMSPATCKAVERVVERVQPSMLRISVGSGKHAAEGTAIVVPAKAGSVGTVAITAASFVGSASSVSAVDEHGRVRTLKVLGVDGTSGVAVVKVPWTMPAAPIATEPIVTPGTPVVLASIARSSDVLEPATGLVDDADVSSTDLMDTIDVDISRDATPGGVILDTEGDVLGVLGAMDYGSSEVTGEFVPSWLAVGVAKRLAVAHRVVHGWLDVEGTNVQAPYSGALVVATPAKGPAATAGIKPGDIVVAISTPSGTDPIHSMADLRGRLYLEPPGTRVSLEIVRDGEELFLSPVLAPRAS